MPDLTAAITNLNKAIRQANAEMPDVAIALRNARDALEAAQAALDAADAAAATARIAALNAAAGQHGLAALCSTIAAFFARDDVAAAVAEAARTAAINALTTAAELIAKVTLNVLQDPDALAALTAFRDAINKAAAALENY